ncbi:MAG: phenylacetate--CoA ligase [Gammaproteobacteria bacterium]|nr:MAG: phenylacetate--CoA ligase [Gammaproteobacteria bacterium]
MSKIDHAELEPVEKASLDELQALQLQRMKWSLQHAYDNVAHYRRRIDEAGVHPSDLKSLADLGRFPLTDKQDLRENYPFDLFAVPMHDVVRIHASSGTTGKPTVVGYTQDDIDMWADVCARSIRAAGGTRNDKVHVAYGYGMFTGGLGAHYGAERLGATVIPMSGGQTEKQVQLIWDFRPDIIMSTPSYMLNLADEFERQGLDPAATSLRVGIFGAEPWTDAMRREIESRCGLDAIDIYGLSEVIGPGVACECLETKDGPTIWEDHFYPEIVDTATGKVLPDGEYGELVFTSLTKQALPIIRYRTRDLTRLLPGTARTMRRMDKITGRSDDMMIIRGVNVFPTQIEEEILKLKECSPHYQIELYTEKQMDKLRVLVELAPKYDRLSEQEKAAVAGKLTHNIKSYIGISSTVELRNEGGVARSEGKAVRLVDKRSR